MDNSPEGHKKRHFPLGKNRKTLIVVAVSAFAVLAVVLFALWFFVWRDGDSWTEEEITAPEIQTALSEVDTTTEEGRADFLTRANLLFETDSTSAIEYVNDLYSKKISESKDATEQFLLKLDQAKFLASSNDFASAEKILDKIPAGTLTKEQTADLYGVYCYLYEASENEEKLAYYEQLFEEVTNELIKEEPTVEVKE